MPGLDKAGERSSEFCCYAGAAVVVLLALSVGVLLLPLLLLFVRLTEHRVTYLNLSLPVTVSGRWPHVEERERVCVCVFVCACVCSVQSGPLSNMW